MRPGVGARAAAVLILIADGAGGPEILFVERPTTMRTHAAQIAFPGGAADPEDADLADTALREAYEETGVDRDGIEVLGAAAAGACRGQRVRRERSRRLVAAAESGTRRRSTEVASVLVVPVARLVDPANRFRVRHPLGLRRPGVPDR